MLYTKYTTYNLNAHKYEQTRIYNKINFENKLEVYTKKYEQNKTLFEKLQTKEYWDSKQINERIRINAQNNIKEITNKIPITELAKFYTTYYGLDHKNCYQGKPEELLFQRHNPCADMTDYQPIDLNYYTQMKSACEIIIGYAHLNSKFKRSKKKEITDKIKAFWSSFKKEV